MYQLISTTNPAQFHSKSSRLVVLISWVLNAPQDIFFFNSIGLRTFTLGKNQCLHFSCIIFYLQKVCDDWMNQGEKRTLKLHRQKHFFSCIWAQYDVNYVQYWKNFSSLLSSILPPYFRNRSSLIRILVYILQLVSSTMSNF